MASKLFPIARSVNPRTFRISAIPCHVTKDQLIVYLQQLLPYGTTDEIIISVVPYSYGKELIATVTFTHREPARFFACKLGTELSLYFKEMKSNVVIDCDFFGITPLYSAREPAVEQVLTLSSIGNELTMEN
jgi:hypothetical protein